MAHSNTNTSRTVIASSVGEHAKFTPYGVLSHDQVMQQLQTQRILLSAYFAVSVSPRRIEMLTPYHPVVRSSKRSIHKVPYLTLRRPYGMGGRLE
jgi:hypothetical protein